jgi:hypothetical protein
VTAPNTHSDDAAAAARAAAEAEVAVNRHKGNAINALRRALIENGELRAQVDHLDAQMRDLKKKLPAEGALVLTADEAKLWAGFKELDAEPSELAEIAKAYAELHAATEQRTLDDVLRTAAAELGWNPGALPKIIKAENLDAEVRDVIITGEDGKRTTEKLLHVRKAGNDKAAWELVDVYITREAADWLPSLESVPRDSGDDSGAGGDDTEPDLLDSGLTGDAALAAARSNLTGNNGASNGRRRGVYAAARGSNGASGKSTDGVRFPAQRAPTPRSRITRTELEKLAEAKNREGDYDSL